MSFFNKLIKLIILTATLTVPLFKAEAFLDVLVLTDHEKSIDKIIIDSLQTSGTKWVRLGYPTLGEYSSRSVYVPKKDMWKENKTIFGFEEFYISKHPEFQTLDDMIMVDKLLFNQKSEAKIEKDIDKKLNLKRLITKGEIFFQDEKSFCTEVQCLISEREVNKTAKDRNNIYGPEIIHSIPVDYCLAWTVDLGEGNFRKYNFQYSEKKPSEEEKIQMINFFKYLEDRIQNVQS